MILTGQFAGLRASRVALLGLCMLAWGCAHKKQVATVTLPPPQPVPVDTTAQVDNAPVMPTVPLQPTPLTPVEVPTKKVKKPKKPATPAAQPAAPGTPVQVASAGPPPGSPPAGSGASAIGELTPGGGTAPELRRQTVELLATVDKRLAGLSAEVKEKEKDQIVRVKNFERQSQTALDAGDPDGALTLATKAKVLLDDLAK